VTAAPLHALAQDERPVPPLPIAPRQAMARDHARALSEMADTARRDSAKCQSSSAALGSQALEVVRWMVANVRFGSKADITARRCDVRFTPKSGHRNSAAQCPLCARSRHLATPLGARYRQNRHNLYGISRKDREVRMPLEQLGGSVMRFRANHRVGAH